MQGLLGLASSLLSHILPACLDEKSRAARLRSNYPGRVVENDIIRGSLFPIIRRWLESLISATQIAHVSIPNQNNLIILTASSSTVLSFQGHRDPSCFDST
jgi:hypothetical protein